MFKNAKIFMLKSNKKARKGDVVLNTPNDKLMIVDYRKEWSNYDTIHVEGTSFYEWDKAMLPQDLYLVTDDTLEVGDYYITELYNDQDEKYLALEQVEEIVGVWVNNLNTNSTRHISNCKKVIATTDSGLSTRYDERYADVLIGGKSLNKSLPSPSKPFIDKYISEYNKGNAIKDCLVEYECDHSQMPQRVIDILKVNKDNEITIKKVKDTYTREEVISLFKKYQYDYAQWALRMEDDINGRPIPTEWINNNL